MLTEAALMGKRDDLRGLNENVIVGRLIPRVPVCPSTAPAREKRRRKRKSARRCSSRLGRRSNSIMTTAINFRFRFSRLNG
jgi:DNA-directed RNA polymerase subunit beta'